MKKILNKKNNKGFSLVELIVVILIMAIIAVALAPQVMKWVGRSGENTDENNMATIKSAVSTAVADYQADGGKLTSDQTFYILSNSISDGSNTYATPVASSKPLVNYILEVLNGDFPEVKSADGQVFVITVKTSSAVEVKIDNAPTAAPTPTPASGT